MRVPISSVSEILGVHQRTLRIWDEEGIVRPERSPKGRRLYTEKNIEEAKAVSFILNEMGLNINGVKAIIAINSQIENAVPLYDFVLELSKIMNLSAEQMQHNKQGNKNKGRKKNA